MPSPDDIGNWLKLFFGEHVPPWVWWLVLSLVLLWFLSWLIPEIFIRLKKAKEEIWPRNPEEERRSRHRRRFAYHIESEIHALNSREEWKDYRFAELEAEVEAEGRRRKFGIFRLLQRTQRGLRRERSLSKALEVSQERLILLEGDPGSGKSVALRHLTQLIASHARGLRSTKSLIPIYVNLKGLERPKGEGVDRNLIENFVKRSLNRI